VPSRADDLSTILGVTHSNGKYYLMNKDYLDEGADQILTVGSKVIKLNLNDSTPAKYPWNSDWPKDIKSLVQMAQTPYFKSVFGIPFRTYILTTYSIGPDHHYWLAGITPDDEARETRQFYDLTKCLLTTYRGTGKTFVLANWEGDWALRDREKNGNDYSPKQPQIDAMIRWFNARMAGIRKARDEVRDTDVHVYGAAEANRVLESIAGKPGVTNSVLPHTTVDLVSYSSWDSEADLDKLRQAVDFLAANLPSTAVFGQSTKSVYLGEFGAPENLHPERVDRVIDNVLDIIKTRHIPWAIYWEIYCNEPKDKATTLPVNGHNDAMKGFWMIKPDGTYGRAWYRYRALLGSADPAR
jgi:hypothetical protein